ncbi:thymidine kinase [Cytobacillus oceanisediminis]|uniref:thymidine kinase n=1 Tax=Cytobacillus oceanisediminis TaxID=665099 RepID=UPI001FB26F49|nr:thymidine kinase [Cytobacillus oceanisediminis]UOE58169.1 thymidine kinase [Cytobacillus oceanisediminis]
MAKLVFYYGSMNSSKSANLLMTAFNFREQGKRFHIIKSSKDTRDRKVKSRALSIEMDCTPVSHPMDILIWVNRYKPEWLFIDEVQFMTPEMIELLAQLVDEAGINVVAYGLLTDFQGKQFPGSQSLVDNADSIREVKNQCIYCENKAIRNMRLVNGQPVFDGEVIQVGGNESYKSVCRKCYRKFKKNEKRCS